MRNKLVVLAALVLLAGCSDPAPYRVDARSRGGEGREIKPGGPTDTIGGGFPSLNHMIHCNFKSSFCPEDADDGD